MLLNNALKDTNLFLREVCLMTSLWFLYFLRGFSFLLPHSVSCFSPLSSLWFNSLLGAIVRPLYNGLGVMPFVKGRGRWFFGNVNFLLPSRLIKKNLIIFIYFSQNKLFITHNQLRCLTWFIHPCSVMCLDEPPRQKRRPHPQNTNGRQSAIGGSASST